MIKLPPEVKVDRDGIPWVFRGPPPRARTRPQPRQEGHDFVNTTTVFDNDINDDNTRPQAPTDLFVSFGIQGSGRFLPLDRNPFTKLESFYTR